VSVGSPTVAVVDEHHRDGYQSQQSEDLQHASEKFEIECHSCAVHFVRIFAVKDLLVRFRRRHVRV